MRTGDAFAEALPDSSAPKPAVALSTRTAPTPHQSVASTDPVADSQFRLHRRPPLAVRVALLYLPSGCKERGTAYTVPRPSAKGVDLESARREASSCHRRRRSTEHTSRACRYAPAGKQRFGPRGVLRGAARHKSTSSSRSTRDNATAALQAPAGTVDQCSEPCTWARLEDLRHLPGQGHGREGPTTRDHRG